uniref:Retroelement silencing factor 1 n=1 Tax=Vombatus ursinus TaxID=29139 RepID=A0A4X2K1N6_VOMUR
MDWNAKPEDNAALPSFLESQSGFLRKALSPHTLTSQSSCNYSRNNQEAFVCPNNKNATLQSLQYQNIESPKNPQQASHPDISSRVVIIPETSTERIPFSQLKVVPNQPDQSSHRSLGAPRNSWLSSSVSDSVFFSRGLSGGTSQTSVGGSVHNALKSQDQYVSSNTYTMQLQMLSSNSSKVPPLYPGNQASNLYSAEQQIGWVPPCTSSGLTVPFHQPSQYLDSQRGIVTNLSNTTIQKQPVTSATPLQVTSNQLLNPGIAVAAPPPPYPMVQSRQYAAISTVTETSNRNLPNYYCRLIPPVQKNSQYLAHNPSNEVLHTQQVHLSETKRSFGRDCQQQWQNTNENGHQKLNVETNYPFNEPGNSFAVGGIPHYKNKQMRTSLGDASSELLSRIPGPSNQINNHSLGEGSGFLGKSSGSLREGSSSFVKGSSSYREGSHSTNSEIDVSKESDSKITKEGLFKDIKKLLAMKNEFVKLAQEIKIKKSFLSESQDKTHNSSLPQNPAMSLQLPSKDQSFPQLLSVNSEHQPLTVMQSTEGTNKTNNTLNTCIKEADCSRQIHQGNSVFPNSSYSGKLETQQRKALFQEPSPMCQKILSAINPAHTLSNQTPLDFNKGDRFDRPQQSGDTIKTSVAQQRQNVLKNKEDNYKLLSHLLKSNNTTLDFTPKIMNQETSAKSGSENIQDCNKSIHSEAKQKMEVTSAQSQFKNTGIPMTAVSNENGLDNSIKLKDRTSVLLNGKSCAKDNNYSMEELTACLALWKKAPSESTNIQKCDILGKNKVLDGMSSPTAVRNMNETILPTVNVPIGHKHESGNSNLTKGIELQIAVVSPLILSEVKPSGDQPLKPTKSSLQSVFPVIQEGSVCSLQDQVKEKAVAASNINTIKRTEICIAKNNFVLTNKFDSKLQDVKLADGIVHSNINSTFSSETIKEKLGKSEPQLSHLEKDICSPNNANISGVGIEQNKEEQISMQLVDGSPVNDDLLQIASVCSLVEGDMFYNSQIANMFNSVPSTQDDKKEVSLADSTMTDNRQLKEQLNQTKFESVSNFKEQNLLKITNVLPKISYGTKSLGTSKSFQLKHCETNDKIAKQKNNVEQNIEMTEVVSNKCCSSTDDQPDLNSKEIVDVSGTHFTKEPLSCMVQNIEQANSEIIFDEAVSVKYLDDQLSELVEEFPYGIESTDTHNIPAENKDSSLQLTINPLTKDKETSIQSNCDSEDPVNQIKITILSSERMKELFPKENKEICKGDDNLDKLENSQKKESIREVQNHCGSHVKTTGDDVNQDSIVPSTGKDDVHCCALGWLSTVYDGVPQCLCDSRKDIRTEEKLDGQSYKGDPATDATKINSPLKSNLQNPPAHPEGKRNLLEMKQDEIKCSPKAMENEKPSFSSRKKMASCNGEDSQENPQKILKARNLIPLNGEKRKSHFWSIKNKEFLKKECSSRDVVSTEKLKRKFKSGCSKFKNPKWKLEQPNVSDKEQKKNKYELEQKICMVNGSKLCESLSSTNEENCEEKTSTDAKSTNLERNVHQSIMNISNVNLNSLKSNSSPCKIKKVLSSQDYFQRQKQKEKVGKGDLKQRHESEKFKKNRSHVSEYAWRNKLTIKLVNCAISNEGHNVRKYKRSLDNLAHHNKTTKSRRRKIHHSKESKICGIARNVQEKLNEKQLDNVVILNRKVNKYNQIPLQGKDQKEQKKSYLNRVAFKCTAQESICLTKLDCSPRRSLNQIKHDDDGNESSQDSFSLEKDEFEKPRMLEFKLCPEELFKNGNSEEHPDFKSFPRKEQVPVQGIKSTKEDWLKCIPQKKRKIEAIKDKDDNALSNSRVYKRTLSVDGCKAVQNPPKDSKTMFQTYKKLYLEKRSRSLDDSPTK